MLKLFKSRDESKAAMVATQRDGWTCHVCWSERYEEDDSDVIGPRIKKLPFIHHTDPTTVEDSK